MSERPFKVRIKLARKQRGFTSAIKLAQAAGVSTSSITNLEAGIRTTSPGTVVKLARALAVPLEWLMDGEGPEPDWSATPASAGPLPDDALSIAREFNQVALVGPVAR